MRRRIRCRFRSRVDRFDRRGFPLALCGGRFCTDRLWRATTAPDRRRLRTIGRGSGNRRGLLYRRAAGRSSIVFCGALLAQLLLGGELGCGLLLCKLCRALVFHLQQELDDLRLGRACGDLDSFFFCKRAQLRYGFCVQKSIIHLLTLPFGNGRYLPLRFTPKQTSRVTACSTQCARPSYTSPCIGSKPALAS